jgi:hypothetical protein
VDNELEDDRTDVRGKPAGERTVPASSDGGDLEEWWEDSRPDPLRKLREMFGGLVLRLPGGKILATYCEVGGRTWSRKYRHLRHARNAAHNFVFRKVHRS